MRLAPHSLGVKCTYLVMTKNIRKILRLIDSQEEIKGKGYFRDEVDNINGLEESLRHLSKAECEQLSEVRDNELYKGKILLVVGQSKLIAPVVKERIQNALW